jgi:hypothetical protein
MSSALWLEAREFTDPTRWRWGLIDASGAFLADHDVRLDKESWQFAAVTDLRGYISWPASPDEGYAADEAFQDRAGARHHVPGTGTCPSR